MKLNPLILLSFFAWSASALAERNPQQQVDDLLDQHYRANQVNAYPMINDEAFVRRAYIDIAGRIPTYEECTTFLRETAPNKRDTLVDTLLDSDAYTSNMFNWWADLLRAKSRLSNQVPGGPEYIDWIKQCITDNIPYDEMVYALLTSEGYPRDNPAVGYYMRDTGMPLDNMSNTAQVFLGTQLQCAQCHDHPFDSWTQKQFYELAAYTYGVQTRMRAQDNPKFADVFMHVRNERMKAMRTGEGMAAQPDRAMFRAYQEIFSPFTFGAIDRGRPLSLPRDYQYDNADPGDRVTPQVIFGDQPALSHSDDPREAYATWMIDPENPRFTKVIANRMWKKVMGRGLFEPVDDLTKHTKITNPELLDHLTETMITLDYDLKEFLRVLYKTELYQREKNTQDIKSNETWHFAGPIMHRMTAEQIWDSMMTLAVENLDQKAGPPTFQRYNDLAIRAEVLEEKSPEEIMAMADQLAALERGTIERQAEIREQAQNISSPAERRRFMQSAGRYQRERRMKTNEILGVTDYEMDGGPMMMAGGGNRGGRNGFERQTVRASELSSPAQPGTFLRQFGQSDRDVIENANADASVPQVLAMMNGPFSQNLLHERSLLRKTISAGNGPSDMIDRLFLTILSRKPDLSEKRMVAEQLEKRGKIAIQDVTWALVNTQQFIFTP